MSEIVFLSGKVTNYNDDYKKDFAVAEEYLTRRKYVVLNPSRINELSCEKLTDKKYMQVCYRLIDIADIVFMVSGWNTSKIANAQLTYAKSLGKRIMYQDYFEPFRKGSENEESIKENVRLGD